MIKYLKWDSELLKKKIGEIKNIPIAEEIILKHLEKAKKTSYQYLILRLNEFNCKELLILKNCGFYISDIGVTLKSSLNNLVTHKSNIYPVREATLKDLPSLKKIISGLFTDSRFYNDPFFNRKEADLIFSKWIENSIRKEVADVVYIIPEKAFITCKRRGLTGEIPLIGVKKGERGKGMGKALFFKAVEWFKDNKVTSIYVRTQLKNLKALNFYESLGFKTYSYDILMANILA
jgi:dTDP-4-amino-4,6-dideoxy-D-galactose acyltransferase